MTNMATALIRKKSSSIFKEAEHVLVGGVNSPVRAFRYVGSDPIPIQSGRGSKVYDYDGNEYIDYVLSYGALILGHSHPEVIRELKKGLNNGLGFGATNNFEVKLAEYIKKAIPVIDKLRFVSSGTEAVMGAVRLARAATKRDKVLKFEHSYHGHADYLLAKSGSGLITMGLPKSKGVPADFTKHTIVAPYGDTEYIEAIFEKCGKYIAAVLVEPVGGNNGVVTADEQFLKRLRSITKRYGTILIFDEVITGFRFRFGSAADYFGIKPDLICLGKIIGGGLPIGAYGGGERLMELLAPLGGVYQASTFSGNPIVMRAGLSTLGLLESLDGNYERLSRKTERLGRALKRGAEARGIDVSIRRFGSMFSLRFRDKRAFVIFHRTLLDRGVYLAPSEYESNFVSFAHSEKDIKGTIAAAEEAFDAIKKKEG